jgi:hypothetical protein
MMISQQLGVMLSAKSVEYYTPPQYIEAAHAVLGRIDLDPASCRRANEIVKAQKFYGKTDDGLARSWHGRVWLNPPYCKADNGKSNQEIWSNRLRVEYANGNVSEALLLVKSANGYVWYENLWIRYPVCCLRERISFIREDGQPNGQAKHANTIVYFGDNFDLFSEVFGPLGRILPPENRVIDAQLRMKI